MHQVLIFFNYFYFYDVIDGDFPHEFKLYQLKKPYCCRHHLETELKVQDSSLADHHMNWKDYYRLLNYAVQFFDLYLIDLHNKLLFDHLPFSFSFRINIFIFIFVFFFPKLADPKYISFLFVFSQAPPVKKRKIIYLVYLEHDYDFKVRGLSCCQTFQFQNKSCYIIVLLSLSLQSI